MQQRYIDEKHPSMKTIRASVLMAAAAILTGFSVLAMARHPLLASAGLSATLGILYAYAGTCLLLPPLLRHVFRQKPFPAGQGVRPGSTEHMKLVMSRFRHLEVYARMFARFKMKFDPMFPKLAGFMKGGGTVLDIGCGYGVQGVWLKTLFPGLKICALDPDRERIRIARRVLDGDDEIHVSTAQAFNAYPDTIETALMIDMIHYIPDEELKKILLVIKSRLNKNGRLILRVTIPSEKKVPWERWLEILRNRVAKNTIWLRSKDEILSMLIETGYKLLTSEATVMGREETWFVMEPASGQEVMP
jgi:SAM-dependent methyltransferase